MDITPTPQQDSTPSRPPSTRRHRTWLAAAGLALAVPAGAFAWSSAAGANRAETPDEAAERQDENGYCAEWTPQDEAAWSAESEALADYLEAHGIEHEVVVNDGVTDVVTPVDPAIDEAVNAFHTAYAEAHPRVGEVTPSPDPYEVPCDSQGELVLEP